MAALKIPAGDFPAFVLIARIDDNSFDSLREAIAQSEPSLSRSKFLSKLKAKLSNRTFEEISQITNALFSLYGLKESREITPAELADLISISAKADQKFALEFAGTKGEVLKDRLASLLSLDESFGLMVKALNISSEYENSYCRSRILTDIRPVFSGSPDSISGAVVVHNLQLGFHDGASGDHKEIYLALNDADLFKLKETIERAEKKSLSIKLFLNNSRVTCVDV